MIPRKELVDLAADYLQAEQIEDGRYRYFDHATREWWRVDADAMADLGERLDRGDRDAYSLWCAESSAESEADSAKDEAVEVCAYCQAPVVEATYCSARCRNMDMDPDVEGLGEE